MSLATIALELAQTCQNLGPILGPAYYIAFLSIWVVLCLPCSPVELIPGFLFGVHKGAMCSLIGKSVGSGVSLYLGRYVFKAPTEKYVYLKFPKLRKLGLAIEKEGFPLLVFIRAMWLPIAFKNYGLAVLNVSISHVLFAGLLTSIPHSYAFAYMGTKLNSLAEMSSSGGSGSVLKLLLGENYEEAWALILVGGPVVVGCAYVFRNFYRRFHELLSEDE